MFKKEINKERVIIIITQQIHRHIKYTTNTWANMKDYDLCINSDMGIDEIAQLIVKVYQNGKLWK